jgi:hypothetical protein
LQFYLRDELLARRLLNRGAAPSICPAKKSKPSNSNQQHLTFNELTINSSLLTQQVIMEYENDQRGYDGLSLRPVSLRD